MPPPDLRRAGEVRLTVFAGDHGVAAHGVSAYPAEVTPAMVRTIASGRAGVSALAAAHGVSVRVLDVAVDDDLADLPSSVTGRRVRRGSGAIHVEDALSGEEVVTAVELGRTVAREERAAGGRLLLGGDLGIGNTTPAAALVAALPDQPVLWDDYQKPYRENAQTPLRFVLQTPALRGAYLLLLLAGLLYVAFRGRRWQRAVPVVAPPPNAQREFARTVGRLHFLHRDDRALAHRMDAHVRDRLRSDLRLTEPALDDETARLAAARAGVPEAEALALFAALRRVRHRPDADDLVRLDARVARFFRHV
mgnify:CR=1 FL=1